MKHLKTVCLTCLVLFALLLSACGKASGSSRPVEATPAPLHFAAGDVQVSATELRMPLAAGETALLNSLPGLRTADLSGSADEEDVAAWARANPQVDVRYTVTMLDGTVLSSDTESIDLSGMSGADCEAAAQKLALLPKLKTVSLGREDGHLSWADIAAMRRSLPETEFRYAFTLYGKSCDLSDTSISLFHVPVNDRGRLVDEIIGYMPQLEYVDMDGCGVDAMRLEEINLRHPKVKVIFRVFFGTNYSVRTDVERILASMPSRGGEIDTHNYEGLFYCHDVKYLDLGHNPSLTDISFVAQMPKLEVAILSMCNWSDASPLAYCTELEYLEIPNTYCSDLRPLSGLKKLRHLNVASIGFDQPYDGSARIRLTDISPLYGLTELERLWIGAFNPVPPEQVQEMQRRAPKCEIDLSVYDDPVGGRWRYIALADYINTYIDEYHPRYIKLREQFADYDYAAYSFSWNDPAYAEGAEAPSLTPVPSPQPTEEVPAQPAQPQYTEPPQETVYYESTEPPYVPPTEDPYYGTDSYYTEPGDDFFTATEGDPDAGTGDGSAGTVEDTVPEAGDGSDPGAGDDPYSAPGEIIYYEEGGPSSDAGAELYTEDPYAENPVSGS